MEENLTTLPFISSLTKMESNFRFSCPKTSQQNGKSERMLTTINNLVHSFLFQTHLPSNFWLEAIHMASHLLNHLPSKSINNMTPFFKLHKKTQPKTTFIHLDAIATHTLQTYPSHYPLYLHRVYRWTPRLRLLWYQHVTFVEHIFPYASMTPTNPPVYDFLDTHTEPNPIATRILTCSNSPPCSTPTSTASPSPSVSSPIISSPARPTTSHPPLITTSDAPQSPIPIIALPSITSDTSHPILINSRLSIVKPIRWINLNTISRSPILKNPTQVLRDPNWKSGMHDEFKALIKSNIWFLVPRRNGVNIVRAMLLYKHKFNNDDTISRNKARLVANGKSQQPGIDYDDSFSPIVKPATIRTVFSLSISRHWLVHQLDVKIAFLHGHLSKTIYMNQLLGFANPQKSNHVCQLQKSLYGLK